jgi:hypothetical protein
VLDPSGDDARRDRLGLAVRARQLLGLGAHRGEDVGGDVVPGQVLRRARRHLESDPVRELLGARATIESDQGADPRRQTDSGGVQVDRRAPGQASDPADLDLLSRRRRQTRDGVRERPVG